MKKLFQNFKSYFPIFHKYPDLVYLDNAATTQRPEQVISAISDFYSYENANIHRGIYDLSNQATAKYELVREKVASFIGAKGPGCIAYTSGTTHSMNIVARAFLKPLLNDKSNIVTTIMEHHANFIPWQMVAKSTNSELRVVNITEQGDLDLNDLKSKIDKNTKLVAVNHISNTLGTINDIKEIIELAHTNDVPVMVDAAQSAAYYDLNATEFEYDFLTFSAHKLFGPFGVGILYVAPKYLDAIEVYNYGGGIIKNVRIEETLFTDYPHNLDAGTPNVAGVVGLGAAIDFVQQYDKAEAQQYLHNLVSYAEQELKKFTQVKIIGYPNKRSGIISFAVKDIHPHDIASFLNKDNIAVRAGMHCTQPLLDHLGTPATVRMSLSLYNTSSEIDRLMSSLKEIISFWS